MTTLSLVLHAHLPYVKEAHSSGSWEEEWLFEAIAESYVPLIKVFQGWASEGLQNQLTLSLSPTLLKMLADQDLLVRYRSYLEKRIRLCANEQKDLSYSHSERTLAQFYERFYQTALEVQFTQYQGDLLRAFRELKEQKTIELITTTHTHAYSPLWMKYPELLHHQIERGLKQFEQCFQSRPEGIWLPECGYVEGLDQMLTTHGIKYTVLDGKAILHGAPRPKYGVFAPVRCPSGLTVVGRDLVSCRQVWDARQGYPGAVWYREFYRDRGFELSEDKLEGLLGEQGERHFLGLKYHRITGYTQDKEWYCPEIANKLSVLHADDFIHRLVKRKDEWIELTKQDPLFVAAFDAELFGHWWFEGPRWLDYVVRQAPRFQINPLCLGEAIKAYPEQQRIKPNPSSWGYRGYNAMWLSAENDWVHKALSRSWKKIQSLQRQKICKSSDQQRLEQALEQFLLAQSSDWTFILKNKRNDSYAKKQILERLKQIDQLLESVNENLQKLV